jgi:hypothetical protein
MAQQIDLATAQKGLVGNGLATCQGGAVLGKSFTVRHNAHLCPGRIVFANKGALDVATGDDVKRRPSSSGFETHRAIGLVAFGETDQRDRFCASGA